MKRMFCVQPYCIKRHKLVAAGATVFPDLDEAVAAGRQLARHRVGIVVLSQDIDASSGLLSKPQIIAIHGRVPASWRDMAQTLKAA